MTTEKPLSPAATAAIVGLGLLVGLGASIAAGAFVYDQWGLVWLLILATVVPVIETVGSWAYLLVTMPLMALAHREVTR